jgi:hypothetical protein
MREQEAIAVRPALDQFPAEPYCHNRHAGLVGMLLEFLDLLDRRPEMVGSYAVPLQNHGEASDQGRRMPCPDLTVFDPLPGSVLFQNGRKVATMLPQP